ncbi:hypothetical protein ACFTAO_26970 [Paenibacillus rhizoplanae]
MSKVYFTSDHHFGHKLIIDFESRPFGDADEMDKVMISNWNAVVGKEDTVFHLGDFFLQESRGYPEHCGCPERVQKS